MDTTQLYELIQASTNYIQEKTKKFQPEIGFILGTGLSSFAHEIKIEYEIPYGQIPNFPTSTVKSHAGKLIFGTLEGKKVVAMAGRFHYYEGYDMKQVTFPVRVLKFLGIQLLIISNAAGGTNAAIEAGDLVFVKDHISLMVENPLRGFNDERLGVRFPDMKYTYSPELNSKALEIAKKHNIRACTGIYFGWQGPNLETPAEYQFINRMGADLVGMSTIPEVLVAKHMELPIFVASVVSNKCYPLEAIQETTVDDVIQVVQEAEPRLALVIRELIRDL